MQNTHVPRNSFSGATTMLTLVPQEIESYAAEHAPPESAVMQALVRETYAATKIPAMQVGRVEGGFLRLLVRMINARRVLEIGTFTGYSALAMAEGLPDDGELITCDMDPEATAMARKYWAQSPHGKKITLKLAPALDTINTLNGPFDLVFLDADKVSYIKYWEACLPKVCHGGLFVADNVLREGKVLDPKDAGDRAIIAFNSHVANDPRVEAVLLTVRDGITIAWKR